MKTLNRCVGCIIFALAISMAVMARSGTLSITNFSMFAGNPQLTIQSDVGVTNQIQYCTNLDQGNWLVLTNVVVQQSPYSFVDQSGAGESGFYRVMGMSSGGAPIDSSMVLIPAGNYAMGDPTGPNSQAPQHTVYVSQFYMDRNLVTYSLWRQLYQWATNHGYAFGQTWYGKGPDHPAIGVEWWDAVRWCNARSEMSGLSPCYFVDTNQTTVYRTGILDVSSASENWGANGYRLPTEAEWEKAARGGLSGHLFPWGDTITFSQANYTSESYYPYDISPYRGPNPFYDDGVYPYTSPVGSFAPNGYGLYDMAGNAFEWCWDWLDYSYYSYSPPSDPRGPDSPLSNGYRVFRGGSWFAQAPSALCFFRSGSTPDDDSTDLGFRCVRGF